MKLLDFIKSPVSLIDIYAWWSQAIHPIINFNILCICQSNLFNFSVESAADFNYYWKSVADSSCVEKVSSNTVEVFSCEVELDWLKLSTCNAVNDGVLKLRLDSRVDRVTSFHVNTVNASAITVKSVPTSSQYLDQTQSVNIQVSRSIVRPQSCYCFIFLQCLRCWSFCCFCNWNSSISTTFSAATVSASFAVPAVATTAVSISVRFLNLLQTFSAAAASASVTGHAVVTTVMTLAVQVLQLLQPSMYLVDSMKTVHEVAQASLSGSIIIGLMPLCLLTYHQGCSSALQLSQSASWTHTDAQSICIMNRPCDLLSS